MIDYSEEVMELRTELARLREVAQMALDALEMVQVETFRSRQENAIEALRKELG